MSIVAGSSFDLGRSAATSLGPWIAAGVFGPAEVHGAAVLTRADHRADEIVTLAAALAIWAPLHGHACVDLTDVAAMVHPVVAASRPVEAALPAAALPWPSLGQWIESLAGTAICRRVDGHESPGPAQFDDQPLVLDGTRLYTQRQWIDECVVAASLRRRSAEPRVVIGPDVERILGQLLPATVGGTHNQQHHAAHVALTSSLAIVVGGPGTGKTHTIARFLVAAVFEAIRSDRPLRIALAAPTGKAAARMGESLAAALESLSRAGGVLHSIAEADELLRQLSQLTPMTIHRLLGARGTSTRFAHDAGHPVDADLVVIDEASMVPLPLMARLLEAVRPDARTVLVGDPDQLESIDVGAVLADVVEAAADPSSPLHPRVVRLDRPHRQAVDSPIGPLADAIRLGQASDVLRQLRSGDPLIGFIDTGAAELGQAGAAQVDQRVREAILEPLQAAVAFAIDDRADDALHALGRVRVLCARRTGPHGAQRWNRVIETWVHGDTTAPRDVIGRALIATRNDPRQRIANGDTGVLVATASGTRAAFRTVAGVRRFAPAQLDMIETAFAMTIHKSQGSEYDTVVVVLPGAESPLIGRELLYTAVTRATRRVLVVGSAAAVAACVAAPAQRVTGLAAALGRPHA